MPLARISIKTALHLARRSVTLKRVGLRRQVRWDDGCQVHLRDVLPIEQARADLKEMRIFVALLKLGVESTEALPAAQARAKYRSWQTAVGAYMERRALVARHQA